MRRDPISTIGPGRAETNALPDIRPLNHPRRPHQTAVSWGRGDDAAHAILWATSDGRIVVKALVSSMTMTGRSMLAWIRRTYDRPIDVVEVLPSSVGFWRRMEAEGMIRSWIPSDGHPNPLERMSVPLDSTKRSMP